MHFLDFLLELSDFVGIGILLALEGDDLLLEGLGLGSLSLRQLFTKLIKFQLHLLLRLIVTILSVLLDVIGLPGFCISNQLVDVHFFFVVSRFILDSLVKIEAELVGLMDTVDQNCEDGHFVMIAQLRGEFTRFDPSKSTGNSSHFLVERTENIRVFIPRVHQNQSDNLRPQLLLVIDDLVESGENLVLLFTRGGDST